MSETKIQKLAPLPRVKEMTVEQALERLGATEEAVAESLRPFTAETTYHNCCDCALVRYLRDLGFDVPSAGGTYVRLGQSSQRIVPLPLHVSIGVMRAFAPRSR